MFNLYRKKLRYLLKGQQKIWVLLIFLFTQFTNVSGQDYLKIINNSEGRNYLEVAQEIEKMYEGKDKGKGTGYKQLQRWLYFHKNRLTADNRIQNVSEQLYQEAEKYEAALRKNSNARTASFASGADWTPVGGTKYVRKGNGYSPGIGRVNVVAADPTDNDIVYAGTPGAGLWRSTNGGTTWTPLMDDVPGTIGISGIAIDPVSPSNNRHIYVLTGDGDGGNTSSIGVFKSTDNGATWTKTGLPAQTGNGRKLVMQPGNYQTLYAALNSGLYKTTNGGTTWTAVKKGVVYDIEFKPGDPNTIYVAGDGEVHVSYNGGSTWTTLTSGLPSSINCRVALAVTPAAPNGLYVLYGTSPESGKFGGVYYSPNALNFTLRSNTPNILGSATNGLGSGDQGWYDLAFMVAPDDSNEVTVGGINCWQSLNGGVTWSIMSVWNLNEGYGLSNYTHADIHWLEYFGSRIWCASDGGVFRSDDRAQNWVDVSAGLRINQVYRIHSHPSLPNKIVCGLQDNGLNIISGDTLFQWIGADGMVTFTHPDYHYVLYGSTQNGRLYWSPDNGNTAGYAGPTGLGGTGNWITPFVLDPNDGDVLYAGYEDVYRIGPSTDWVNISNGDLGTGNCDDIAVSPTNSNVLYVAKWDRLYTTSNLGSTWRNITNYSLTGPIKRVVVDAFNSSVAYVVARNGLFKVTASTTPVWTTLSNSSLPNVALNCFVQDTTKSNNAFYLGTDLGVYYKDDDLSSWIPYTKGMPRTIVNDIEIHYATQTVRIGTYARGVWQSPLYNPTGIQVSIPSPSSNTDYTSGQNITVNVSATTTSGTITKVELFDNGIKIGEDFSSPYSFTITGITQKEYVLNAVAYNSAGSAMVSSDVRVYGWNLRDPENPDSTLAGLDYKTYTGTWDYMPDFQNLTPVSTGTVSNFSIASRQGQDNYGFFFTGYITIPTDGIYTFYTQSDDGSMLYIGSDLVVNNDGLHGFDEKSHKIGLKAGKHSISVMYFERNGGDDLAVYYSGPSIPKQSIPNGALTRFNTNIAPSVSITAPANNATFTAPASITITASANDVDGSITKVVFYEGTTLLYEDFVAPYSYTWTGVAAGSYTLKAQAVDNNSATANATINVTVTSPVGDVIGPDCATGSQSFSLEVNPTHRTNATGYNWYSTASLQSFGPVSGMPYKANVVTNSTYSGGNYCVGVSYSSYPYYVEFCKSINPCPGARTEAAKSFLHLAPNPAEYMFSLKSDKTISNLRVTNMLGSEVYSTSDILEGTTLEFGKDLPYSVYNLNVQYADGSEESLKILKTR